jgi:F-type H+-transporting ATPase subunit b
MEILSYGQITLMHGEFSLNTNILETNLINQILLFGILIFAWKNFNISEGLDNRRLQILESVENSEKRLNEAILKLAETKKQLSQAKLIISQIKKETDSIKLDLLTKDYSDTKTELNQKFEVATSTLKNRERLILTEIKQSLSFLALKQVVDKLENEQESGNWTKRYIDENIEALKNLNLKDFKK